ncbi:putative porin [Oleiharenicola lentus]|uniref:putative porin n=1 Tax=Oleiharenicola lentus TaxID=2508720 RepID=UPI003F67DD88
MSHHPRLVTKILAVVLAATLVPSGAYAVEPAAASPGLTVALIRRLAERGAITSADAESLLLIAEAEAAEARAHTARAEAMLAEANAALARARAIAATPRIDPAPAVVMAQVAPTVPVSNPARTVQAAAPEEIVPDETVRVTYVPEVVKRQLRDEIRRDVLAQAREENWASPRALPDWISRFRLFGDLRVRYEATNYPPENLTGFGSSFWNYNAINTGSPFDYTGLANPPFANVTEDRQRARLRARLGTEIDLSEGFAGGIRIATGENNSPVTQNQSLGAAGSGQGGNFSKYALWLDRGFLRYQVGGLPDQDFTVSLGRFDNPFFSTNMIWADDIGFDGLAMQGRAGLGDSLLFFFSGGAFPVFNTDLNFATTQPVKFKSNDKWLYGSQLGVTVELGNRFSAKIAAGYYHFENIEGRVSTPFIPLTATDAGDTDATRPTFAQKGNTYIALRDITPDVTLNANGTINQWQYFGLATPFEELASTMQLDYTIAETFQVSLLGEYVKNLAFDEVSILAGGPAQLSGPVNNNAANGTTFGGGDTAWNVSLKFGSPALQARWDWSLAFGYRKVETDAVIDGFTDTDFGGGGTNSKGFTLVGNLALSRRVWLGFRWLSAREITGPTFESDVMQLDLNGKF